jgi:hypothetical protein
MKLPSQRSGFHICDILELNTESKYETGENDLKKESNKKDRDQEKKTKNCSKSTGDEKPLCPGEEKLHISSSKYLSHLANSFASSGTSPSLFADAYNHLRQQWYENGNIPLGKFIVISMYM